MMKNIFVVLICISSTAYAEDFEKNETVSFTHNLYGNAESNKKIYSRPELSLNYHIVPKWNVEFEWNRPSDIYNNSDMNINQKEENNSSPELKIFYDYGFLNTSNVKWNSSLSLQYEDNYFGINQAYMFMQTAFDFAEELPKAKYFQATQFSISPMYIYSWNNEGQSSYSHTAVLSLLSQFDISESLSFTFNAYDFRSWTAGEAFSMQEDGLNETVDYFMVISYLNYSHNLYDFTDNLSLDFNISVGFDPWIYASKKIEIEPFLLSNQKYGWAGPEELDGSYKNTYNLFALPQFNLSYEYDQSLAFDFIIQENFSNQIWGDKQHKWRLLSQYEFGLVYHF